MRWIQRLRHQDPLHLVHTDIKMIIIFIGYVKMRQKNKKTNKHVKVSTGILQNVNVDIKQVETN